MPIGSVMNVLSGICLNLWFMIKDRHFRNFVKTIIVPLDKKDIGHRADKYDRASPPSPYKNRYSKVTNSS